MLRPRKVAGGAWWTGWALDANARHTGGAGGSWGAHVALGPPRSLHTHGSDGAPLADGARDTRRARAPRVSGPPSLPRRTALTPVPPRSHGPLRSHRSCWPRRPVLPRWAGRTREALRAGHAGWARLHGHGVDALVKDAGFAGKAAVVCLFKINNFCSKLLLEQPHGSAELLYHVGVLHVTPNQLPVGALEPANRLLRKRLPRLGRRYPFCGLSSRLWIRLLSRRCSSRLLRRLDWDWIILHWVQGPFHLPHREHAASRLLEHGRLIVYQRYETDGERQGCPEGCQ
mmetsp:Transcript_68578/g.143018  ORF Transcript_68578/g.143018 Transcript_68578/m.143018 type:complete len:286 (-) Transcript_68578:31-888(-)